MDNTAGMAIAHIKRTEYRSRIQSGQSRCKKALDECLSSLQKSGFRLEGYFKVVENDTGIFLKTKR